MIQDISPHEFHLDYDRLPIAAGDAVLAFCGRELLVHLDENGTVTLSTAAEAGLDAAEGERQARFLFSMDDTRFYLWLGGDDGGLQGSRLDVPGFSYQDVRFLRTYDPQWLSFACSVGLHLYQWYRDNRFCGRCGHAMEPCAKERAMRCPACGNVVYPRINPCVIIGLTDGDRLVCSRYAGRAYKGVALLAGYVEVGETPEAAVVREVAEEVGLRATNVRYVGSQPWGMDGNLLLGYFCDVEGSREIRIDEDELSSAEWFSRDELADLPNTRTLTFHMIDLFRRGLEPR